MFSFFFSRSDITVVVADFDIVVLTLFLFYTHLSNINHLLDYINSHCSVIQCLNWMQLNEKGDRNNDAYVFPKI